MCGRFGLSDAEQMERRFGVEATARLSFEPTYNAAPGQDLPVVVPEASGNTLTLMRRGPVPWLACCWD
jgi:putative SOS response-associated peptidase YedK